MKRKSKKNVQKECQFVWSILLIGLVYCAGCASSGGKKSSAYRDRDLYTRTNLRYDQDRETGSYIGYTKLKLLPVNSKVQLTKIRSDEFVLKIPTGQSIDFGYREEWGDSEHKPIEEILPLLFSHADASSQIYQFNEIERKGIKHGIPYVGMSKKAIIVALGLPAAHRTPSLEDNLWTYWHSRYSFFYVQFADGKVSDIGRRRF